MMLFLVAFVFVLLAFFYRAPVAKRILWGAAVLVVLVASSFLWVQPYLAAQGCTGVIVDGLICPEPSALTRLAITHLALGYLTLAAGVFAAPTVVMISLWFERRYRRREGA